MSNRNFGLLPLRLSDVKNTLGFPSSLSKVFGNLKIRPKLIALHNIFFLILTAAVYCTLIPIFEERVEAFRRAENEALILSLSLPSAADTLRKHVSLSYREGSAPFLKLTHEVENWLRFEAGTVQRDPKNPARLLRFDPSRGLFQSLILPEQGYENLVKRTRLALFGVLACLYVAAVLALELVIMPRYVYQPIRAMLDADEATLRGDRASEMIDQSKIPGDEIGTIMRSRNQTVAALRNHEDSLEQALDRLEAQDRLASLGMLSASVAHEMNTPLAVLHGSIEKLIETVSEPQAQDRLQRMVRVTRRLKTISEGLVDFARVRRQVMEPVAVQPLLEEAWSLVAIDEKAREVQFSNQVPESARVIGNSDRLIQVFVNLLRNSLLAVNLGGSIVALSDLTRRKGEAMLLISIEDDGPGIPADVLPEIFNAFVSSRLDSKGTGLGLTVAQGIVDQHNGTIQASNRPSGGARIEVALPAALPG